MNDIYGIVEVSNRKMLAFYFVTIHFEEEVVVLSDRSEGKKILNLRIPITEMTNYQSKAPGGNEIISFDFQKNNYRFIEYGNKTVRLFGKLLEERMYLLT